jgi:hypothetical protein
LGNLNELAVKAILGLAGKGKWYALAIGTLLFGFSWLSNIVWPGNPLGSVYTGVEAGIVSATSVVTVSATNVQ